MATKSIAWNTGSGDITLIYTGQGDGSIQVSSDPNNLGSARSQAITIKTTKGGVVTKNLTINQAACPFPVGDIKDYSYTGNVQSVLLPAGSYKLQCWGAQGGSNAADSSHGITVQAGSKGGYSEGVLTIANQLTIYAFVGGQGSTSGNGGWNGGGGSKGSDDSIIGNSHGYSTYGCGGGATDFTTVTSPMTVDNYTYKRSAASYLARMIVAGGGAGGAMSSVSKVVEDITYTSFTSAGGCIDLSASNKNKWVSSSAYYADLIDVTSYRGGNCRIKKANNASSYGFTFLTSYPTVGTLVSYATGYTTVNWWENTYDITIPSDAAYIYVYMQSPGVSYTPEYVTMSNGGTEGNYYSTGNGYGGGVSGGGHLPGTQTSPGSSYAGFGYGSYHYPVGHYMYNTGGAGGGWYGGAIDDSNYTTSIVETYGSGGSGFVNTAESAGNRPSGYTGLQLDSGETIAGDTSFPAPGGGNEVGHVGNGYARITRLS